MEDVSAKFVSQKISRTRWRPLPAAALQPPDLFATGSWDNEVPAGRARRRGATFPPELGAGGGGTPRHLGPLRLGRLERESAAGAGRKRCLARLSRPSLGRAVLASPRKPRGRPGARQRYPPGQALRSGRRRRLPLEPCAARSVLLSLAEPYCSVLSKAFSSKCAIVSVQDNRISIWSAGDLGNAGLNGEYHGEPHLLCDIQHNGDVMDMQVK